MYIGACLKPQMKETVESYCKRVQKGSHCKIPTKCKKVIKPTDGCCPICGKLYIIVVYICSYHNRVLPYNMKLHGRKLSRLHGKLLFCHKTFAVAYDGPKNYAACDGDY